MCLQKVSKIYKNVLSSIVKVLRYACIEVAYACIECVMVLIETKYTRRWYKNQLQGKFKLPPAHFHC